MLILKPDGLFGGDRVRHCSDAAQLHWPRIFLASNGFARIELNYFKIVSAAYSSFAVKPTQAEIEGYLLEYMNNDLLFPYEFDGQAWGQWDAIEQHLPRFKTAEDERSPSPPEAAFAEWKDAYYEKKRTSGISKMFPKCFRNSSEGFPLVVVDVGAVAVEGVDAKVKNICSSNTDERASSATPLNSKRKTPTSDAKYNQIDAWFDQCWSSYWRKVGRKAGLKAFRQRVATEETFRQILAGIEAQRPMMLAKEEQYRVHFSTFVNGERWLDEVAPKQDAFAEALEMIKKEKAK